MPRSQASQRRPEHQAEASEQAPPAALAERLGFLLKHAYQGYQSIQSPAISPLELDGRLLAVLMVVKAEGAALQQRVAERLGVDRTTMVGLVDALERSELVKRRRDAEDRRGYQISLTAKGTQTLHKASDVIRTVEREFLAPLSAQEQRQLRALLRKVVLGS